MVALVNTGDHIRIEVNLEATQRRRDPHQLAGAEPGHHRAFRTEWRALMRFPGSSSFAHRMTLLALLTSSIVSITLMASFLAYDSVSAREQMQNRLASLADIVGQNSAAALVFDDRRGSG